MKKRINSVGEAIVLENDQNPKNKGFEENEELSDDEYCGLFSECFAEGDDADEDMEYDADEDMEYDAEFAEYAEKEALHSVLNTIRKIHGSGCVESDDDMDDMMDTMYGDLDEMDDMMDDADPDADPDADADPDSDSDADPNPVPEPIPSIADSECRNDAGITYPGQCRSKRYRSYSCYKNEYHKIPISQRNDYAYYTADNALITIDPDIDEEVTPEMIYRMHCLRDNEITRNNRVIKHIPPKEKKALAIEYGKKKNCQSNCYKELKDELNARYTFVHYDAWEDGKGKSMVEYMPCFATQYSASPENIAIQKMAYEELVDALDREISKLDDTMQMILHKRFALHMANKEIGEELNISESYVRELTAKALRKLRRSGA